MKSTVTVLDGLPSIAAPEELKRAGGGRDDRSPSGKPSETIRILLVDDHPVVRKGLGTCLSSHPGLQVVGEAGDGLEALRKIRELSPDLVLMDVDMPLMNGLAATECICRKFHKIKVLMISMHNSSEYAMRAIRSGARGFILKRSSCEEMVNAINTVHSGGTYFSGEVVWFTMRNFRSDEAEQETPELSERQIEVLICVVAGKGNKQIAEQLDISVRTVESHRARIMQRLSVHTIAELTKYALSKGLISLDKSIAAPAAVNPAEQFDRMTVAHAG
ncbi:MAG TPA: response regulator transcription factor [Verrucomicrobiae bacterium]|nr:response regulator transcription factor [Verrucomicrobiae bacterium]